MKNSRDLVIYIVAFKQGINLAWKNYKTWRWPRRADWLRDFWNFPHCKFEFSIAVVEWFLSKQSIVRFSSSFDSANEDYPKRRRFCRPKRRWRQFLGYRRNNLHRLLVKKSSDYRSIFAAIMDRLNDEIKSKRLQLQGKKGSLIMTITFRIDSLDLAILFCFQIWRKSALARELRRIRRVIADTNAHFKDLP